MIHIKHRIAEETKYCDECGHFLSTGKRMYTYTSYSRKNYCMDCVLVLVSEKTKGHLPIYKEE
jgi:hypothetical protein